jgi:hypothetical protein
VRLVAFKLCLAHCEFRLALIGPPEAPIYTGGDLARKAGKFKPDWAGAPLSALRAPQTGEKAWEVAPLIGGPIFRMVCPLMTRSDASLLLFLRNSLRPARVMAFVAHATTAITFGTAIYAWFFPEVAGDFLARLTVQMDAANQSAAITAESTTKLAESVADRPKLTIRHYKGSGNNGSQTQFSLQNTLSQSLENVVMVYVDSDGKPFTSFDIFTLPPFESVVEPIAVTVTAVCTSYVVGDGSGQRYTEYRTFLPNLTPTRDDMGNAGTYDVKTFDYVFAVEPDPKALVCDAALFDLDGIRQMGLDQGRAPP